MKSNAQREHEINLAMIDLAKTLAETVTAVAIANSKNKEKRDVKEKEDG